MTLCELLTYSRQILEYVGLLGLLVWLESVMRFRFLWISLALGLAAAVCARTEGAAA